jgi:hypothetical protein
MERERVLYKSAGRLKLRDEFSARRPHLGIPTQHPALKLEGNDGNLYLYVYISFVWKLGKCRTEAPDERLAQDEDRQNSSGRPTTRVHVFIYTSSFSFFCLCG